MGRLGQSVILLLFAFVSIYPIDGAEKIDIQAEVQKIANKFEKIEKPSPAMVNAIMDQVQESCRTNRTIDNEELAKNISQCMDGLFNETALVNELQEAIPKGNLENVFKNICLKWPKVKTCFNPGFEIIEDCWENGTLVNSGVDAMVQFFCGENNDGAYIALFFAEGGLSCLEANGDKVQKCVNDHNTEEHQENLCLSVQQVMDCLTPLRNCSDVTPHNLATSMMMQVGKVMQCPPLIERYQQRAAGSSEMLRLTMLQSGLMLPAISLFIPSRLFQ